MKNMLAFNLKMDFINAFFMRYLFFCYLLLQSSFYFKQVKYYSVMNIVEIKKLCGHVFMCILMLPTL